MLHKLRRRLILQYTVLTALILNVALFASGYINILHIKSYHLEIFNNLKNSIEYKISTDTVISNTWLSELEVSNQLIIGIEENGIPFFYKGSWTPPTDRATMIAMAKETAQAEGLPITAVTAGGGNNQSSVFMLKGSKKEPAYGYVSLLPIKNGYKILTLIQFCPSLQTQINKLLLFFGMLDFAGVLLLFFCSSFLVKLVLKPVEESQQRQQEFIAAASHDLRTPLAVIQANASALLVEGVKPKQYVPVIAQECQRMSKLIGDLLVLSSSDAGSWRLHPELIDTETYLIELYDSFSMVCQKRNHLLELKLQETALPKLCADKDRLTQVLGILIDNAISYSPEQSMITLYPYCKKNTFCLEVIDHGTGIAKEQREQVFRRFYRGDKSRNDGSHFGLGLSIARELMELQDGKISVKETKGGGAAFLIEIPLPRNK